MNIQRSELKKTEDPVILNDAEFALITTLRELTEALQQLTRRIEAHG